MGTSHSSRESKTESNVIRRGLSYERDKETSCRLKTALSHLSNNARLMSNGHTGSVIGIYRTQHYLFKIEEELGNFGFHQLCMFYILRVISCLGLCCC